ncbi:uncharacterized protein Z518_09706 [Rhinocladiella mackenziei CBS 650.93]|uniref:C3H1-type domain-containing protein n=1 Tax=Rhinocladiella mackenziei CBS 650.93 TaxID=1442369 RepID=A0A0D2IBH9_9EURO|nr:uncharacterized protein Z518_09706 [Rhinocladiella mackenziei CBS 650.93]KIX00641.1 hypothetical protein Z518_09706 [Rhinocladiella mackenziei CBS 650.93]
MSDQQTLKPQFFVTRRNGAMVPLIAMDELPIQVEIRHVPRNLTVFDIAGMTSVGVCEARHQYYIIEGGTNTKPWYLDSLHAPENGTAHFEPWGAKSVEQQAPTPVSSPNSTSASFSLRPKAFGIEEPPSNGTALASCILSNASINGESKVSETTDTATASAINGARLTPKRMPTWRRNDNVPGTKEYCSYWIRHGECDYAQQGCMYKHEIPLDLETLNRIGHRDIPRWYREKHGLGSLLVAGGQNGPSYGVADRKALPRNRHMAEDARRMIHRQVGPSPGGRGGSMNTNENRNVAKENVHETKKETERQEGLSALPIEEEEEEEEEQRKALQENDTFNNGEEPDDLMARIGEKGQHGWEEEKANATGVNPKVNNQANKQADSGKPKIGGKRNGGGGPRKNYMT